MKKTKFLKKIAYPAAPQHESGFVPPAGFDFKMSVSLRGKDIKIYGFDGAQWEMIHSTDGLVDDFIGNVLHQKYYFESKTGEEQLVRVSFLSSEEEADLELDFGSTDGSRKFHHIEEVPAYRGGDEGKFLTIRTDGSLAWLGLNESYVVEVIGTGGEPAEENPQVIAGTFLEELQSASDNAQQAAEIVDGVFFRTKAFNANGTVNHDNTKLSMTAVDLEAENIISYTNNVADTGDKNHVEFSMSFWAKPAGGLAVHSMFAGLGGGFNIRTDGNDITVWYPRGGGLTGFGKTVVSNTTWTTGEWEHICLVVKQREDDPTKWAMYIYKGGQPLNGGNWIASTDSKLIPDSNVNSMLGLGGQATTQNGNVVYNGMDGTFYLDSFQIAQGVVLTDEQVAAIAAQTDRQMYIETAAQPSEAPAGTPNVSAGTPNVSAGNIVGLEETVGGTFVGSASLIDGVLNLPAFQDRMSIPANPDHQPDGGAIAYSAWINLSKLPDSQTYYKAGIMSNAGVGPDDLWEGFSFQVTTENSSTGGLLIASNAPGNRKNQIFDVPGGISINEWHHVAFTRSASGTCSAYFDGSLIGSYEGGSIQSKNVPITIGSQFGGAGFGNKHLNLTGQIDGIKIEKIEKSAGDILSEYNAGL